MVSSSLGTSGPAHGIFSLSSRRLVIPTSMLPHCLNDGPKSTGACGGREAEQSLSLTNDSEALRNYIPGPC